MLLSYQGVLALIIVYDKIYVAILGRNYQHQISLHKNSISYSARLSIKAISPVHLMEQFGSRSQVLASKIRINK